MQPSPGHDHKDSRLAVGPGRDQKAIVTTAQPRANRPQPGFVGRPSSRGHR